jgi:oxygen-independent coproporphyrinogen-3 oxidase
MLELPPLGLYVHIPWCVKKCPYCDFNSHPQQGIIPEWAYIDQLLADLTADLLLIPQRTIETIFIGGGTPSLLTAQAIGDLLKGIRERVPLAPQLEITLEANPGTVEQERFIGYQAAGVNRFSIGVQSFNPDSLSHLGRIHSPEAATQAVQLAMSLPVTRVNLDLMHGLPHQSLEQALYDLEQAVYLAPTHLSWYQLTLEPQTEFGSRPPPLPADEQLWEIWQQGDHLLKVAGYQPYEISAYARDGHYSQHNLNYWRFGDYLGIGCGAHGKISFPGGKILRTVKTRHPRGYLQGHHRQQQLEVSLDQRPLEFFMNRWRLFEPTPRADFTRLTGMDEAVLRSSLDQLMSKGYLEESPTSWRLTQRGRLFLNNVLEVF